MADQWRTQQDSDDSGRADEEQIRGGVDEGDEDDFDEDSDDLDEEEEDEESTTF
jgi:hypothetical protein